MLLCLLRLFPENLKVCLHIIFFHSLGFENPFTLQQRAIKAILNNKDVIVQDQSGTGKTSTISIALLQSIDTELCETQVLCLLPTQSLAIQAQEVGICLIK